ncbi:SOS response regulatory protein OraA/RecX, interacts with RecA [Cyclonatronum proteinivorum]|uniref:Regulatory protein RecX n=1 Tax=Cyclonatronum proteinivorum TaxID=1457365 RepID=A0A345UMZ5_9BACT|nr:regulatory protein RecX [Cyclonatronum proteinivorum]AXJ01847.1 SOS response regulatory protein OraA/RecX, interacts with RecA [Cyclonatronum proteinivorum]
MRRRNKTRQEHNDAPEPEFSPGRITSVSTQTRNSSRVSVFIEGAFSFGCFKAVFLASGLAVGRELDAASYAALMKEEARFKLREYWLGLLGRRAHTAAELVRKARQKDYDASQFERVLQEFRERNYLNDEAFARAYIQEMSTIKKWGPAKLKLELRKRGVSDEVSNPLIAALIPEDDISALEALVRKNSRRFKRESDILKRKKKIADHLLRKGHKPEQVFRHLDHFLEIVSQQP